MQHLLIESLAFMTHALFERRFVFRLLIKCVSTYVLTRYRVREQGVKCVLKLR